MFFRNGLLSYLKKGFKGVCAIDFYDDIFMDDLAEKRMPEDYRKGEYHVQSSLPFA